MRMRAHLLAALHEQHAEWEASLAGLPVEQIVMPRFDHGWSIQDVVAHLWGWQQITNARLQAAAEQREPVIPEWILQIEGWEHHADRVNAQIYAQCHQQPWEAIYSQWHTGFRQVLSVAGTIPERDLLDSSMYAWLHGHALAAILLATYDHHQEHLEQLQHILAG
jgi:hypothetical protein